MKFREATPGFGTSSSAFEELVLNNHFKQKVGAVSNFGKSQDYASSFDGDTTTVQKERVDIEGRNGVSGRHYHCGLLACLRFVTDHRRPSHEKIFWTLVILSAIFATCYTIGKVWTGNGRRVDTDDVFLTLSPSSELKIQEIPFPAITICNMNQVPKSLFGRLQIELNSTIDEQNEDGGSKKGEKNIEFLKYLDNTCRQFPSFAKEFGFATARGNLTIPKAESGDGTTSAENVNAEERFRVLLENSTSCDDLIRLCLWEQEKVDCSQLFKPTFTKFGKCCTFNGLPHELLFRSKVDDSESESEPDEEGFDNKNSEEKEEEEEEAKEEAEDEKSDEDEEEPSLPSGSKTSGDGPEGDDEISAWGKWNYKETPLVSKHTQYPRRQVTPGLRHGLSILIDPDTREYFCPRSDSRGVQFSLHSPLDAVPEQFGSFIGVSREVFLEIIPEVTTFPPDEQGFRNHKNRKCLMGDEKELVHYRPYTRENCRQDCLTVATVENCECIPTYLPKNDSVKECNSDPDGTDFQCFAKTKSKLDIGKDCGGCPPPCTEISYTFQSTVVNLQLRNLWQNPDPEVWTNGTPPWASHLMSIVHFYVGRHSITPRVLRRVPAAEKEAATAEVIATSGGIIAVILGINALSLIDLVYSSIKNGNWKEVEKESVNDRNVEDGVVQNISGGQNQNGDRIWEWELTKGMSPIWPIYRNNWTHTTINASTATN